ALHRVRIGALEAGRLRSDRHTRLILDLVVRAAERRRRDDHLIGLAGITRVDHRRSDELTLSGERRRGRQRKRGENGQKSEEAPHPAERKPGRGGAPPLPAGCQLPAASYFFKYPLSTRYA